jgi:hypothetical protein
VERAAELGVGVLGICDHDTVSGLTEAIEAARLIPGGLAIELVPAVEINCDQGDEEIHVLGYFIDPGSGALAEALERLRRGRVDRMHKILEKLRELGHPVSLDRVMAFSRGDAVGRPHAALALAEAGHVRSPIEAFDRLLARGAPAYVPRMRFSPAEAIATIRRARGVPVVAHPGKLGQKGSRESLISALVRDGLEGIEVYHPDHTPQQVRSFRRMAAELGLLAAGGTDSHGPKWPRFTEIGSVHVPAEVWEKLRERRQNIAPDTQDRA